MSPPERPALEIDPQTRLFNQVVLEPPFKTFGPATLERFTGGAFSYLAPQAALLNVTLGRYCSIAPNVAILGDHPTERLTTSPFTYQRLFPAPFDGNPVGALETYKATVIGNDVWIGMGALLKCGLTIGDGAVIGAGSVVTHDVPPFTIVAGVPAREIRPRFAPAIQSRIQRLQWWNYNLTAVPLPWENIEAVLDILEASVAAGTLAPYRPDRFALFTENTTIRAHRLVKNE